MVKSAVLEPRTLAWGAFLHEWSLLALGTATLAALLIRAGPRHPAALETAAATALFAASVLALRRDNPPVRRLRYLAAYAYILWFYLAVVRITPALGTPPRDAELFALDRAVFGDTPAVLWQYHVRPWLTELFSTGYLSYLVYLHVALIGAFCSSAAALHRLAAPLFNAFAAGLLGYLLVPAVGPAAARPDAFAEPLTGGVLTRTNDIVVSLGSSRYDVFPSLHVLIPCVLLAHDRRAAPRRFRLMLLPTGVLFASILYLRYHYAVDLAAGLALFLMLAALRRVGRRPALQVHSAAASTPVRTRDTCPAVTSGATCP